MSGIAKEYVLGEKLVEYSRKELCEFAAALCRVVREQTDEKRCRGGIYPDNISVRPDGRIEIGPASSSGWSGQELDYLAPEIYWNNAPSVRSDVYAIGLLLYYGASAGRLPFEGESSNAQLMRMSGKPITAPASSGKPLGEIIEKALRFKESERFGSLEEMAVMLDYCEDQRLFDRASSIFRKPDESLSDMEMMMVDIIEGRDLPEPGADAAENAVTPGPDGRPLTEDELFTEAGFHRPETAKITEKEKTDMKDLFGLDEPDPRDPAELEQEEDIRVYQPGGKQGIPILTEDPEPELAPVTVKNRKPRPKQRQAQPAAAKQEEYREEQKRRPFLVVLMLLAVLLIAAVVAKILIDAFSPDTGGQQPAPVAAVTPAVENSPAVSEPTESFDVSSILSEEQIRYQQEQEELARQQAELEAQQAAAIPTPVPEGPHSYEAIRADVGWLEARDAAVARGGQLVTINSQEELETVVSLAEQAGFDRIWIGGHRENGELVWESGETDVYYNWDNGEPSYTDSGDGAAEDYVMLWYRNGRWVYNDSRENPLTNFYGMYGGHIGYVVEKVG